MMLGKKKGLEEWESLVRIDTGKQTYLNKRG